MHGNYVCTAAIRMTRALIWEAIKEKGTKEKRITVNELDDAQGFSPHEFRSLVHIQRSDECRHMTTLGMKRKFKKQQARNISCADYPSVTWVSSILAWVSCDIGHLLLRPWILRKIRMLPSWSDTTVPFTITPLDSINLVSLSDSRIWIQIPWKNQPLTKKVSSSSSSSRVELKKLLCFWVATSYIDRVLVRSLLVASRPWMSILLITATSDDTSWPLYAARMTVFLLSVKVL